MLTKEQIDYFECFGFLHLRQAFSNAEVQEIGDAAERVFETEVGRLTGEEYGEVDAIVERDPRLTQLVTDERIHEPVRQLLGDDFLWSGSEGKRGIPPRLKAHHWHADRPGDVEAAYNRLKIMLYLDSLEKETGAFRVIPGSHRPGFNESLMSFNDDHLGENPRFFGLEGPDVPCHSAETTPGDIVIFHHSLYHAVYGKRGARRYIAMKFVTPPVGDEQILSLQKYSHYVFHPAEAFVNSEDERIRRMVSGFDGLARRLEELTANAAG